MSNSDILTVRNGFILRPNDYDRCAITMPQTYVFNSAKQLAKFIETNYKTLDQQAKLDAAKKVQKK